MLSAVKACEHREPQRRGRSSGLPSCPSPEPHAHPHRRRCRGTRTPTRDRSSAPGPQERWRAGGEWGSVPAGPGGAGARYGLCASALGLSAGEETAGTGVGGHPAPPTPSPPHRSSTRTSAPVPPPGTPLSPRLPSSLSCPHSGHRPSSSAVLGAQRWCPPQGAWAATQPLVPGRLRPQRPQPRPAAPARRTPLHPPPGPTCLVAQLG